MCVFEHVFCLYFTTFYHVLCAYSATHYAFSMFCIFILAWLLTPIKVDQEKLMGWDKIMHVYQKPNPYYFTVVFPLIALLVLVVGNFALYGALDSKGMRSF